MTTRHTALLVGITALLLMLGCTAIPTPNRDQITGNNESTTLLQNLFPARRSDDWTYRPTTSEGISKAWGGPLFASSPPIMPAMPLLAESVGFSVGGAKDINNFRENIKNQFLPLPTDITYEGLFYDYYFETGTPAPCRDLFCPTYSQAISRDPFSGRPEHYLSVGLTSGITSFERPKLNLVVVLDISGSMSSAFDSYYYDRFAPRPGYENPAPSTEFKAKMEVARESLAAMLDHLHDDDRVGIVLFDDQAVLAKPLRPVRETDMPAIKRHVLELTPQGGTNMEAGMTMGSRLFEDLTETQINHADYENRIIFLTDAMPNLGDISETGLLGIMNKNARRKIYSTFIGIGVDLNTELIETITKIPGANYLSVHSSKEFSQRLDDEFDFMVTPLVFNLELALEGHGARIEHVYGSPEANEATGTLMKVNTLFPSAVKDEEVRGGVILLKITKTSPKPNIKLSATYTDRNGVAHTSEQTVQLLEEQNAIDALEPTPTIPLQAPVHHAAETAGALHPRDDVFEHTGIRKAILLSRYADLLKNWLAHERAILKKEPAPEPLLTKETGIILPPHDPFPPHERFLSPWERTSQPLHVSGHYQTLFKEFNAYMDSEIAAIGDEHMKKETEVLTYLIGFPQHGTAPDGGAWE